MPTKIDPVKQGTIKTSFVKKQLTSGNKIFAPVGISYIKPKDKLLLEITSICIKDLEGNNEEGCIHTEKFWVTDRALWRIANWALSMRKDTAFDCENLSEMESIIANGVAYQGSIEVGESNGYRTVDTRAFSVPSSLIKDGKVELTEEMSDYIVQGEEAFPKIIKKRREYGTNFVNVTSSKSEDDTNVYELNNDIPF